MTGFLREEVTKGQFLNQKGEIELLLGRSVVRMEGGRFLEGQSRIHRGIIFRYLDLMMVVKMRL